MTNEEAKKMLKAKLDCLTYETAGCNYDCNNHLCDGCNLNYAQGNMGEQKEALEMAIKALQEEPQRAKGHLVSNQQDGEVKPFWERYRCSVCGEYAQDNFNYCSRCGADMRGDSE